MEQIVLENVQKTFGDQPVLKGLNLSVKEGETMVVIGRSGCGKSVMLKHIIRIFKPDAGRIFVDGEDITDLREYELFRIRKKFGVLFQGAALLDSLTVWENVGLGLIELSDLSHDSIRTIVKEKLAMVGMEGTEEYMPADLSGGMKKRVGLARAIVMEPEIVLYDEPTTGLDPITATQINKLINKTQEDLEATSIVVTHDVKSALEIGDRLAFHYDGKIAHIATKEDFLHIDDPILKQFLENSTITEETKSGHNKRSH